MTSPLSNRLLRSTGAVVAGLLAIIVLSIGTDLALYAAGVFPAPAERMRNPLLLLATVYRSVYTVAGSYLTARLAPDRPMQRALILGLVGLVLSTIGAVAMWNGGPPFEPKWYPLALIAIAMPSSWLGHSPLGRHRH